MMRTLAIVLGTYAVLAFAVFLFDLVINLEEGLPSYDAFVDAFWTGAGWPLSVMAMLWR